MQWINRILTICAFLLPCGSSTVSAQRIVEWGDLQVITDNAQRTVYYENGQCRTARFFRVPLLPNP